MAAAVASADEGRSIAFSQDVQEEAFPETQPTQTQQLTQTQPAAQTLQRADAPPTWAILIPVAGDGTLPTMSCWRGQQEYTIGRSAKGRNAADFILSSKKISGKHARIACDNEQAGGAVIEDLSTNGTWVNQVRLPKNAPITLNQGDEICFGPTQNETEDCRYIYRRTAPGHQSQADGAAAAGGLFEKYDLRQQIGKGSFATVRAAVQISTGRLVAIKIINKRRFQANEKTMDMLRREVEICKRLRHPYIASFEDYFEDDTHTYMVLEYVDGGDLLEYVTGRGGLSEGDAQEMARQVCTAVAYLHSEGIAHRDLKPDNLLLTRGPRPVCKVSDFGLAKLANEATFLRTMCGTPSYLAPEVILQNEEEGYSFACDAWSIGVLVYAALANALPFEEDEKEPLTDRMMKRRPDLQLLQSMGISNEAMDFVARLMVFDPKERMTCAEALRHTWLRAAINRAEEASGGASAPTGSMSMLPAAIGVTGSPMRAGPRYDAAAARASVSTEAPEDEMMGLEVSNESSEYRKQLQNLGLRSPRDDSYNDGLEESKGSNVPISAYKRKVPLLSSFSSNSSEEAIRQPAKKRTFVGKIIEIEDSL